MSFTCTRRPLLVGSAALALSPLSSRSEPEAITIFVAPRPAQATAVAGWSANLDRLAVAAIAASGRQLAPGRSKTEWIGANFAKHHVIPQGLLQVAGGLALDPGAGSESLRMRLKKALVSIAAGPALAAGGATFNLGPVAWSPVNLFEGPTGFYRSDDPGERGEPIRPKSFDQKRWAALEATRTSIEALGTMTERKSKDGYDFRASRKVLTSQQKGGKTGLEALVEGIEALSALDSGQPVAVHTFAAADWVDNAGQPIALTQLIAYKDDLVQTQVSSARKAAYHLASKTS